MAETTLAFQPVKIKNGWLVLAWVMMLFRLFAENQRNLVWLYGTGEWASRAWIGPILAIIFLLGVFATRSKWQSNDVH